MDDSWEGDKLSLKRKCNNEEGEDSNKKRKSAESTSTAGEVSSTIVRPNSPEEEEPPRFFTPPCEQARQFLEVPLNVTSRTQHFRLPIPVNLVRNVPKNKNTAPATQSIAPPNNSGNDTYMLNNIQSDDVMEVAAESQEEEILPEATEKGIEPVNPVEAENDNLIYPLLEIFPEACPEFIRRICRGKTNAPGVIDDLISEILQSDYPKRNGAVSPEAQLEMLKEILPDADPSYLEIHCDRLIDQPEALKIFIANAIENPTYPKLKDYLRKQQISAQQKQYTTEFNVENFLGVIPDPRTYFESSNRKQSVYDYESEHYAICFLSNHFRKIPLRGIQDFFKYQKQNVVTTFKLLEKFDPRMQMKTRPGCQMPELIQNIPLLQEIAYIQHRYEIEEYIRLQKLREKRERVSAAAAGLMQLCSCCFDNKVLPKHIYTCENGCTFCKECVQRGAEVSFGEAKLDFACLNNCSSHFSLQTLQAVLNPKLFSKIAIKKQVEEIKAAGIEDLEMCPFCDFATIPAKEDRIFRCHNPDCMKESCRLCKEPSHVPLRCEEVEKDDDIKKRTYIENKMTEALLRTCYKCNKKFIKAEGCNKMTCSCGALMCYICGKPVKDYTHFNGDGGDRFDLCPLFSDTNKMHQENVLMGAAQAKKEVGVDDNSVKMKIDPTSDVEQHYRDRIVQERRPPRLERHRMAEIHDPPRRPRRRPRRHHHRQRHY